MHIPAVGIFAVALLATLVAPARAQAPLSPGPGANDQADPFASGIPPDVSPTTILANGDPPLTESMVDVYNNLEAWLFELPRTPQQRNRVRAMMIEGWKKPAEIKGYMRNLSMAPQIAKLTPDQREFVRWELQPKNLEAARADKNNPDSQRLLAAYEQAHPPIAPGNPPLTESLVSRFISYLGWVLQIRLTQPLKDTLRAALLEDWKDPKEIKTDMGFLNWQVDMASRSPDEREYFRSRAEPEIIKAMRADKSNPAAPWIGSAYDAAHPSIAPGDPPLTRQAADAYTELLCFIRNQAGGPRQEANQAFKDSNAQILAQTFPKLPPEQQQQLAHMPQDWATLRVAWAKGSQAERQNMVAQWQPLVGPSAQADPLVNAPSDPGARCELAAFLNKDPRTMSMLEVLRGAADCDTLVQELRRKGGKQNLATAAIWEQEAKNFREAAARQIGQQPSLSDRLIIEAHQAEARKIAFDEKRDPRTVSEQELIRIATDCDTVAQQLRREGGEANLANALTWEQQARNLRAGKQAWVKRLQARDAAEAAAARYNAFIKRDANSVSEQELAAAAKDAFSVAQYHRGEQGEQSPLAAGWDQAGRALNAGKEAYVAYVRKIAGKPANAPMTAAEFVREYNRETMRYVTSMNIIANMSSTGYHYGVY